MPTARRVALVDATPEGGPSATTALLDDLEEALGVYARLYGEGPAPEVARVRCPRAGDADAGELVGCDTVLLGSPDCAGAPPASLVDLLRRARGRLAAGTRAYALVDTAPFDPERAEPALEALARLCEGAGARWMGGVVVGGSELVRAVAGTPRMGALRRGVSEAVDRLIAAVRSGAPAGTSLVRPAVPRRAYGLALRWAERRAARHRAAAAR